MLSTLTPHPPTKLPRMDTLRKERLIHAPGLFVHGHVAMLGYSPSFFFFFSVEILVIVVIAIRSRRYELLDLRVEGYMRGCYGDRVACSFVELEGDVLVGAGG